MLATCLRGSRRKYEVNNIVTGEGLTRSVGKRDLKLFHKKRRKQTGGRDSTTDTQTRLVDNN
jgi:hypothetical protein